MSSRHFFVVLSALLSGVLVASFAGEAKAGGCYGGCAPDPDAPIIHKTYKKRIQVEQGVYEIVRKPSVYGWTVPVPADAKGASYGGGEPSRRVLLKPYRNIAVYNRAQHVYTRERVAIQPEAEGEWSWWDHFWHH